MDRRTVLGAVAGLAAGCARPGPLDGTSTATASADGVDPADAGFTHVRPGGNRYARGSGDLLSVEPLDVEVDGTPAWVVAAPAPEGARWVTVTENGSTAAFRVRDDVEAVPTRPAELPSGLPPVATADGDGVGLLSLPADDATPLSPPFPVGDGVVYIAASGELVLSRDGERDRLAVDAPSDARVVGAGAGQVAVLGGATGRYSHGALGDDIEAGSVLVVSVGEGLEVEAEYTTPGDAVVEGLAPILADLAGDPAPDVVVTESGDRGASQVAHLGGGGTVRGPPVGTRFRWRHQLAVAPFAPDGTPELAAVRTPHIGGVAEFYRPEGGALSLAATVDGGYRSHTVGSRNLDGGVAADVDGDGSPELVVPTRDRRSLAVLGRTGDGAAETGRLPVGGRLSTNVAASPRPDGGFAVAAGREGGLRLWLTPPGGH